MNYHCKFKTIISSSTHQLISSFAHLLINSLFIIHCSLFTVLCSLFTVHCSLLTAQELKFKVVLKDGGVLYGTALPKKAFIVTDFARIKVNLSDIDSVVIGILPYYLKQTKIVKLLKLLNYMDTLQQKKAYKKLISMQIGAIPVIRNYIDTVHPPLGEASTLRLYTPENVLNDLEAKYKVGKDFVDRDVVYLHSGFKIGGFFSFRRNRALIKFGRFVFSRNEIEKIIFIN